MWNDAPPMIFGNSEHIASGLHGEIMFEVRKGTGALDGKYYVTAGPVFYSQTAQCESADVAIKIVSEITKLGEGEKLEEMPPGSRILPNTIS